MRKIGKLFDCSPNNLQLFCGCGCILFCDKVKCGLELDRSLIAPQYPQGLTCSGLSCPTSCLVHECLMFHHFACIVLAKAFFDQATVIVMK